MRLRRFKYKLKNPSLRINYKIFLHYPRVRRRGSILMIIREILSPFRYAQGLRMTYFAIKTKSCHPEEPFRASSGSIQ
jgi:hypothetical protein